MKTLPRDATPVAPLAALKQRILGSHERSDWSSLPEYQTKWLRHPTSDVLQIQQGSLYPALHRLERRGWIKAHWVTSENNRRAKYHELTKGGRKQLELEKDAWEKLTTAVTQILGTA